MRYPKGFILFIVVTAVTSSGFSLPKKECYRKWVDQGIIKQQCEIRYFYCPVGWTTPCPPGMEPSN
jgi:hypothetical protein